MVGTSRTLRSQPPTSGAPPSTPPLTCCAGANLHAESAYDDLAPHAAVQPPFLLKERLRRAIATVDSDDATLFLLRHVEGLSIDELAGMFQIEKNNVTVKLHRIRLRLQAEMER